MAWAAMGLPENRVTVQHIVGASEQFVLAGSGQRAPLPGYHRMSTGEHMRNDDQTGGVSAQGRQLPPNCRQHYFLNLGIAWCLLWAGTPACT